VSLLCPELVEVCGLLGFQWMLLDAEHTPIDHALARNLIRAADGVGMPCIVRVPEIRASIIEGFLDSGALGIIAPNISSAAEAAALVAAVKFSPEGQRGSATRTRAAHYGLMGSKADFYGVSNARTLTVALIESRQGIDALDEILNVPGLDYIAIGTHDLSLSVGVHAAMDHFALSVLISNAQARIKAHGKPQLAVVSEIAEARAAMTSGARLIAVTDSALFAGAARTFLLECNEKEVAPPSSGFP
jgi:2-keto-3-deoxy-L-rhamnonate aldolase RhmA